LKLPLRISEEADAEMAEAARWYEQHRIGLGLEFLAAVDRGGPDRREPADRVADAWR